MPSNRFASNLPLFPLAICLTVAVSCDKPQPSKSTPAPTTSIASSAPEEPIELLDKAGRDIRITDDEIHFLPGILAKPEDAERRAEYAGWLEQQSDPRAKFLRMGNTFDRLSFVEWVESGALKSELDYYAREFPQVKQEVDERKANQSLRNSRQALASTFKPSWVAFMTTFGCPFELMFFFDSAGPNVVRQGDPPFSEQLGTRGPLVTFEYSFRTEKSWDPGLMLDMRFLRQLKLSNCFYGPVACPVYPFICELKNPGRPLTARDILTALHANRFKSRYITELDVTSIEKLTHQSGFDLSNDDEIHNDFSAQLIFQNKDEKKDQWISDSIGTHGILKRSVDGKLWYVLLHTQPQRFGPLPEFAPYVILFAVGKSPNGDRLLGVVSHQRCGNR